MTLYDLITWLVVALAFGYLLYVAVRRGRKPAGCPDGCPSAGDCLSPDDCRCPPDGRGGAAPSGRKRRVSEP